MTLDTACSRFLRRVLSWARFAGLAEDAADDVAQDVFTAFRKASHVLPDRCVKAWLRTTTRRMSRRHLAVLATRLAREEEAGDLAAPLESQERALAGREVEEMLLQLVARLEPKRREVFRRHALDGETMEQVAAALAIPVNTARKRFSLARQELQAAVARARARERRTARGATSFAFLPFFSSVRRPGRGAWKLAAAASPVLVAVALVLAIFLVSPPELALDATDAPARSAQPVFAPVVSFLEAPREREAFSAPSARPRGSERASVVELPELELVALARLALAEGSPVRARGLLARADRAYPRGSLLPERAALAARAAP